MRLYIFCYFFLLTAVNSIQAQFCTGALGDNIFLEGSFGSGTANLQSPNPNIAPGYVYTFNVPPFDGEYVITNNTASWPNLFPTWLAIGDNSNDPNGYMMIVNASNAAGLFYEQTVNGLCENTLYEFSADIINLIKSGTPDHSDPNVSFLLNGVELFSTGDIAKTNSWTTYGFTFTTDVGQQSLTLSLRNNAPGGFGNDLAIDNISFRACGPETDIFPGSNVLDICEGDAPIELQATITGDQYVNPVFQWQQSFDLGQSWVDILGANSSTYILNMMTPGSYYFRYLVADGINNISSDKCRVNTDPKIININSHTEAVESFTICQGSSLMVGNSTYSNSGIYTDTLVNTQGCDSIITTDLTVVVPDNFTAELMLTPSCINIPTGSISVVNVGGGTEPYTYFFDGVEVGMTTLFSDLSAGESHTVLILDNIGCTIELTTMVEQRTDLSVDLGNDQSIELGETILIEPIYNFEPTEFTWSSADQIDCMECISIDFLPTRSQLLTLELFEGSGCSVTDSVFIEVVDVRKVFFPNIFSPNSDGVNDYFTVFASIPNVDLIEEMNVYDRWGSLVYENNDFIPNVLDNAWGGRSNNRELPSGVYVYTAVVRFLDGEVLRYSGDVTLVR